MAFPDLLHREPLPTRQGPALSEALTFGFARGVDPARLLALAAPTLASSSFEQAAFASDLFITELIRGCFPLKVGSSVSAPTVDFFRNVLLAPPRELEDTRFRQEIFRELLRVPERRQGLEGAYRELLAFRDALCGSDTFGTRALGVRRRLDVLLAFRNATMALGAVTGTATSGLSRLSSWVDQIKTKQSFRALLQLLDFENGRAVLETRLQAGYDGTLRRFDVVGVALMEHEAFPRGAIARFFGRLVSLLKGYRFSEEDIMATLLDRVFADLEEEVICLLGILLELEFYLRGLSFHDLCQRSGLAVCLPELRAALDEGGHCEIKNLFNPWLVADEGTEVVPCDVFVTEATFALPVGEVVDLDQERPVWCVLAEKAPIGAAVRVYFRVEPSVLRKNKKILSSDRKPQIANGIPYISQVVLNRSVGKLQIISFFKIPCGG